MSQSCVCFKIKTNKEDFSEAIKKKNKKQESVSTMKKLFFLFGSQMR